MSFQGKQVVAQLTGSNVEAADGQAAPAKAVLIAGSSGLELRVPVVTSASTDGFSLSNAALVTKAYMMASNGTHEEFWRSNAEGVLLASAERTAHTLTAFQVNHNAKAVTLILRVTGNPGGAETLELRFYPVSPVDSNYGNAPAKIVTTPSVNSSYKLMVGIGVSGTPDVVGYNVCYALPVPRRWVAEVRHSGGSPWTYSLGYQYTV